MARPNLSYLKTLILVVVGIPCGVLSGVTGQSASPILIPVVKWLLGTKGTVLTGIVVGAAAFSAWAGLLAYAQTSRVGWALGVTFALGSFGGAAWAGRVTKTNANLSAISRPLGAFLAVAVALFLAAQAFHTLPLETLTPLPGLWLMPLAGLALGIAVGFFGQAADLGSVLTAPTMYLVLGQTIKYAQGTALLVTVLAALPIAVLYLTQRLVDLRTAGALTFGVVLGSLYGSRIAIREGLPDTALLLLQSLVLIGVGLSLLFQKATPSGETREK